MGIVGRKPIDYEGPLVQLLLQVTRVDHLPTTTKSDLTYPLFQLDDKNFNIFINLHPQKESTPKSDIL